MKKITKLQAIKAIANGQTVGAIASKLSPWFNNGCFMVRLHKDNECNNQINDTWINSFKWYNCNKETGQGVSFYLIDQ